MSVRCSHFEAIGTVWEITVRDILSDNVWTQLLQSVQARIESFDIAYSRFRPDTLVTRMSEAAGSYELPPDAFKMLDFYHKLYTATDGNVTPLIGQVMSDAGYDASYSLQSKPLRKPPNWEDVLEYDAKTLTIKQPALLDFGAAGKGYLVDLVAQIIDQAAVRAYTINAGGDILHRDTNRSLEVGLENPLDTSEAIGMVRLGNRSFCASAGSRRKWGEFHHIIDPIKLQSPRDILATWVIADETMLADGMATALFFTDAAQLAKQFIFSYALLRDDMSLEHSQDFPARIFEVIT